MENHESDIKEFHLNDIQQDSIICLTKAMSAYDHDKVPQQTLTICNIIDKLLNEKGAITHLLIISSNEKSYSYYKKRYPYIDIHDSPNIFNYGALKTYYTEIYNIFNGDVVTKYLKITYDLVYKKKLNFRGCVVLDIVPPMDHIEMDIFRNLIFHARHHKTSVLMTGFMNYPPDIRLNVDYLFVYHMEDITTIKKIYDYTSDKNTSFDEFKNIFIDLTKNGNAIVVSNRSQSDKIIDKIFWYAT